MVTPQSRHLARFEDDRLTPKPEGKSNRERRERISALDGALERPGPLNAEKVQLIRR